MLIPIAELTVAVLLFPTATAWWAGVLSLTLLGAFVSGIGVNLARGRRPDCHCFGQLHSEPIGAGTLVRNGVLAALAALLVWQGPERVGPSTVAWLGHLTMAEGAGFSLGAHRDLLTLISRRGAGRPPPDGAIFG